MSGGWLSNVEEISGLTCQNHGRLTKLRGQTALSIQTTEATILCRATGFNKANVRNFFSLLKSVLERNNIAPQDIRNVDE